jgi:hypothetical protein
VANHKHISCTSKINIPVFCGLSTMGGQKLVADSRRCSYRNLHPPSALMFTNNVSYQKLLNIKNKMNIICSHPDVFIRSFI